MSTYWGEGGVSKQRITFDQLNLTQFVNGFVKGVLDEKNVCVRPRDIFVRIA